MDTTDTKGRAKYYVVIGHDVAAQFRGAEGHRRFASVEDAVEAIAIVRGWDAPVLSATYTVDGPRGAADGDTANAWSVYETESERDEDETGAHAPRIVEAWLIGEP